jgi:hypothetical protein
MMQFETAAADKKRNQFGILNRSLREAGYGTDLNGIGGERGRTNLMDDERLEPGWVNSHHSGAKESSNLISVMMPSNSTRNWWPLSSMSNEYERPRSLWRRFEASQVH